MTVFFKKFKKYYQVYKKTVWLNGTVLKDRKSDTVFILGSGASINSVSDWEEIRRNDSLGFNFFMAHQFTPDFYFIEIPKYDWRMSDLKRLIQIKGIDYWRNVELFVKRPPWECADEHLEFKSFLDTLEINYKFIRSVYVNARSTKDFVKKLHSSSVRLNTFFSPCLVGQGVASIEAFCTFLIWRGYKKIIFVGVDLNNTDYFYTESCYDYLKDLGISLVSGQAGKIHKTNDPDQKWGALTVTDVIKVYAEYFSPCGVELYSYTATSELAKFLPVWKNGI